MGQSSSKRNQRRVSQQAQTFLPQNAIVPDAPTLYGTVPRPSPPSWARPAMPPPVSNHPAPSVRKTQPDVDLEAPVHMTTTTSDTGESGELRGESYDRYLMRLQQKQPEEEPALPPPQASIHTTIDSSQPVYLASYLHDLEGGTFDVFYQFCVNHVTQLRVNSEARLGSRSFVTTLHAIIDKTAVSSTNLTRLLNVLSLCADFTAALQVPDALGRTPYMLAIARENIPVLRTLQPHAAATRVVYNHASLPLLYQGIETGNQEVVHYLLFHLPRSCRWKTPKHQPDLTPEEFTFAQAKLSNKDKTEILAVLQEVRSISDMPVPSRLRMTDSTLM